MGHSLVKVFVHLVWTAKNRERMLVDNARKLVREHIIQKAQENGILVDSIDVQPEHVHLVVRLAHDQQIDDVAKSVKGESSHWVNQNDIIRGKFSWQTGYTALSVGAEGLGPLRTYIANQDEHHRRKSFTEEI